MSRASRRNVTSLAPIEAALFDMDGVITRTAEAHAAAWKRLFDGYLAGRCGDGVRPFDADRDYRRFVDGKPRYQGVDSFLSSRGIVLPYGSEQDAPGEETVCGLGNRKNVLFRAWLEENEVGTFAGTLRLIRELRAAAVKTAVFSASRNAEVVLRSAGVFDLFDAKVDGSDLAALGLPGKPDPAMLVTAAARLDAAPARSAVFEDALAGVEAGARGGFGLVVGIAGGARAEALRAAGADVVVASGAQLMLDPRDGLTLRTLAKLPSLWQREAEVRDRLAGKALAVFLDYDGTLTPLVEDQTKAILASDMRAAIADLSRYCTLAVVSGRDVEVLRRLVGLDSVFYAGSHGFEIAGPEGRIERLGKGLEVLPDLERVEAGLRRELADVERCAVERNRFSIAVRHQGVAPPDVERVEATVRRVLASHPRLKLGHGETVLRIRPAIDWDKGQAVHWLLDRLGLEWPGVAPLYVGDDITDEDAFLALAGQGLGIAVRDGETRPTAADYALAGPQEVRRFLAVLSRFAAEHRSRGIT